MSDKRPITIFMTAWKRRSERENQIANQQMQFVLTGWDFPDTVPILGSYHGVIEEGFAIKTTEERLPEIIAVASMFRQDTVCVERLGPDGVPIGFLHSVSPPDLPGHLLGRARYSVTPPHGDWTFYCGDYIQYK